MPETVLDCCCQQEIPFEYLDVKNHPTPSQIAKNVSQELVDVYLQTCTPIERKLFGRDKPLKGPKSKSLWINPKDRSGRQVLITPTRVENIQALTHQGILEIGKQIEKKMSEKNKKIVEKAVQEAEELAKFEADRRVKFHVENETEKVADEWEKKLDEVKMHFEKEIEGLKKEIVRKSEENEDLLKKLKGCEELKQSRLLQADEQKIASKESNLDVQAPESTDILEKGNFDEIKKHYENLLNETLTQQSVAFQEELKNTLQNLEVNDRDRMKEMRNQCLKAMDTQNHLNACRQITEMMQLLATQRKQNKRESIKVETSGEISRLNQSKSIKYLWWEFLGSIDDVNDAQLDSDERKIFDKIQKLRDELVDGERDAIFVISEREINHDAVTDVDVCKITNRPIVEWEESTGDEILDQNSFTKVLFEQPKQRRASEMPKIASSIMRVARDEPSEEQDILMKKLLLEPIAPDAEVVPLPRTEAAHIKDSVEVFERHVSICPEPQESTHLLAAVDSLELLTGCQGCHDIVPKNSMTSNFTSVSMTSLHVSKTMSPDYSKTSLAPKLDPPQIPGYLKPPEKLRSHLYSKMTKSEWEVLRKFEQQSSEEPRKSSVLFDGFSGISRGSRKSSILKNTSVDEKREIDQKHTNALYPIQEKCREIIGKMKVEKVLKLLCDDDDE